MKVALDGTPLILSSGGLRRFTEELLKALRSEYPDDDFCLVSDQLTPPTSVLDRRWWSIGLPRALRKLGCDLFHGTDFAVPYIPVCPAVMSVHDVSPWMDRAWHSGADRVRRRTPLLLRVGAATMVMTPTNAVRRQVIDLFRVSPDRIAVVPEAPAPHLRPAHVRPSRSSYFLFVGTIEPRKNLPALLRAWRSVRAGAQVDKKVDLVIAGRRREDGPVLQAEEGLILRGEVTDAELADLYSGATALVYPSFYEGFGLPVVEAMQCGTPVITSKDPALVEVGGDAVLAVTDPEMPSAMQSLLCDEDLRRRLSERGLMRAREFSWRRSAQLAREVYAEAAGRFWFRR